MTTMLDALKKATQYFQTGNFHAAEATYRQILRTDSTSVAAHLSLGNVLKKLGRLDEAADSLNQAIRLKPDYAQAHNDLGNVLLAQNDPEAASVHYLRALEIDPSFLDAHNNLGVALKALGRLDAAADSYRQAIRCNPRSAPAHLNLGTVLRAKGNLKQAIVCARQAIDLEPGFAQAYVHLGGMLQEQGNDEEAVNAFHRALRLRPNFAEAFYNLGNVFVDPKQQDEAAIAYRHAIQLKPDWADPHASLAAVLSEQGKPDEAIACLQEALRLAPTPWHQIALATRLPVVYQSGTELELWRDRLTQDIRQLQQQRVVHDLTDTPAPLLFYLPYQGRNDREIMQDAARLYRPPPPIRDHNAPLSAPLGRKIRVGFVSSFFRDHAVGHWTRGLVAHFPVMSLTFPFYPSALTMIRSPAFLRITPIITCKSPAICLPLSCLSETNNLTSCFTPTSAPAVLLTRWPSPD